jgi:bifunctional enzyme CysN/CysC
MDSPVLSYSDTLYPEARPRSQPAVIGAHARERDKGLLRFLTCGSVDDGKSTLIGRLLYEAQTIHEDHFATLEKDSRRFGTTGEDIDFALLVDGLEDERQQGITIDVAYRFFATEKRSFIVADTPGHEQYTRNMATGASNSDLAIILVDARKGVLPQTKRHATICSLLGIKSIVLAVNKIDLVGYDKAVFDRIVGDFTAFSVQLGFTAIVPIPVSARFGDNIVEKSGNMAWYYGPTLMGHLESVDVESSREAQDFRFPVQWVNRPNLDFRGYSGTVASGRVRVGEPVVVAASGRSSTVTRIVAFDSDLDEAKAGDAVTLTLADEVDITRGDVLAPPHARPSVADQFSAQVIWMIDEPLLRGRQYLMRIGMRCVPAAVTTIKHKLDVEHLEHLAANRIELNEIASCNISTTTPVVFDPYAENPETGSFILIDRFSNATAAAGMIDFPLRRASNVHRHATSIDKEARASLKHQKPAVLWFTGLSGSGKSTVADIVERKLHEAGYHTFFLDGDNVRHGLNRDLGFTDADRVENIRRVGEISRLFVDAGLLVLCSFISPFEAERQMVRERVGEGEFIEIFVDTPLEECMRRDPKGLYAKARRGEIKNFTGIDSPYEVPDNAELHLKTAGLTPEALADKVVSTLHERGIIA